MPTVGYPSLDNVIVSISPSHTHIQLDASKYAGTLYKRVVELGRLKYFGSSWLIARKRKSTIPAGVRYGMDNRP